MNKARRNKRRKMRRTLRVRQELAAWGASMWAALYGAVPS